MSAFVTEFKRHSTTGIEHIGLIMADFMKRTFIYLHITDRNRSNFRLNIYDNILQLDAKNSGSL